MPQALRLTAVVLSAAFLVIACSSPPAQVATEAPAAATEAPAPTVPAVTDTPVPAPTESPTATPAPTEAPTATALLELPDTPVKAVLGADPQMGSKFDVATGAALEYDESELPVPLGAVEAHWFVWSDRYVVAYAGLDLAATGPLCPGNSIRTPEGFEFVSNAPTGEGACEGLTTLTTDPTVGPRVCQGIMLYVTAIPSDRQGFLFGTLNKLVDDGAAVSGLTSVAQTSPDIATIDLETFCG